MDRFVLGALILLACGRGAAADEAPLSEAEAAEIDVQCDEGIRRLTVRIGERPDSLALYSRRGDANFFRGRFEEAVADYRKMVEIESEQEKQHWRLGIAYFYAGQYDRAAAQFEMYHSVDDVDRENGIWRYLSQFKAKGRETARRGLLVYEKDDREPFPSVYRLFGGNTTPVEILDEIAAADISDEEREKRLFYAELYIGLNHAVEGDKEAAVEHLREAVRNEWPRDPTRYGPHYMWHVGRLHYGLLMSEEGS